ncbi:PQQ-binding-like beta-propeller repeat protein [Halorubrum sp. DTA98]|uniref:outer membrane protein assembly factor BamB family protein n=1 Tax=Halorubrum sp. DTA98 TaxID=3402163 RepID=UPI003AAB452E
MSENSIGRRTLLRACGTAVAGAWVAPSSATAQPAETPTVYVGSDDGSLYAVDATDGTIVWRFTEPGDEVPSSPTVVSGVTYVGSIDGTLYAVDAETGEEVWRFDAAGPVISSPTVVGGTVYVGSREAIVYAIAADTGDVQWTATEPAAPFNGSPAVVGGRVYIGSDDGVLYGIDADTGDTEWMFMEPDDGISASPTVADGTVYVPSFDERLYAVDAATGDAEWTHDLPSLAFSSPTIVDGTVHVGVVGGGAGLRAVDAATGDERWTFTGAPGVVSSPTVADGTVYVGSLDETVYALDAVTGEVVWAFDGPADQVNGSPTVFAGSVYVGSDAGTLYALDADSGDRQWAFTEPSNALFSSPTVVSDPVGGHSVGTRVALGTLGHHHEWAGTVPPEETSDDPSETDDGTDDEGDATSGIGDTPNGTGGSMLSSELLLAVGGGAVLFGGYALARRRGSGSGAITIDASDDTGSSPSRPATESPDPDSTGAQHGSEDGFDDDSGETASTATASAEPGVETGTASDSVDDGGHTTGQITAAETEAGTVAETGDGEPDLAEAGGDDRPDLAEIESAISGLSGVTFVDRIGPLVVAEAAFADADADSVRLLTPAEPLDDAATDRFAEVVTDWGGVSHYDGIVTVYDHGVEPQPWAVTDTPPDPNRPTLASLVAAGNASLEDRLRPVLDAAEALRQAGRYTVRHYYLSPDAVPVAETADGVRGTVDLWGLPDAVEGPGGGTRTESPYAAPEQRPDSSEPLWRSKPDLFALGGIAYYAATGEPPSGPDPTPPSEHADVPDGFDRVISRGMSADPDERHDSIASFQRALNAAVFD